MSRIRKYNARKTIVDGITFDSKAEANRWIELKALADRGEISLLERQVVFELIPKQLVNGKTAERSVTYKADFVYHYKGDTVVEDVKGVKTPEYIIKRKLMLYRYGIKVQEV